MNSYRKGPVFIGVALLCMLSVLIWRSGRDNASAQAPAELAAAPSASSSNHPSVPTNSSTVKAAPVDSLRRERLDAIAARRPDAAPNPAVVDAAVAENTAWTFLDKPPTNLPLDRQELTDGRQFIRFDATKIETLMPGDTMKVAVDKGQPEYEVIIDSVEKNDADTITWQGHLDLDDGQTYSVNFTRGKELTVAGIDTPLGNYALQAHGNTGWIAASGMLFKTNPNVDDGKIPANL